MLQWAAFAELAPDILEPTHSPWFVSHGIVVSTMSTEVAAAVAVPQNSVATQPVAATPTATPTVAAGVAEDNKANVPPGGADAARPRRSSMLSVDQQACTHICFTFLFILLPKLVLVGLTHIAMIECFDVSTNPQYWNVNYNNVLMLISYKVKVY
jgi:hypothetical protein